VVDAILSGLHDWLPQTVRSVLRLTFSGIGKRSNRVDSLSGTAPTVAPRPRADDIEPSAIKPRFIRITKME
jgi:hypothetical protein